MDAFTTYGPMTTLKMPTLDEIKRSMNAFERRWPRSERAVAIEMPRSTEESLLRLCGQKVPVESDPRIFTTLYGLKIETNHEIEDHGYCIRMADGSKVMHYASGWQVRCLAQGRDG